MLLEHSADPNCADPKSGASCLHLASWNGSADAAALLLAARAVSGASEARGCTPLHLAAQQGHRGCVAVLLKQGESEGQQCALGLSPLDLAIENGQLECARLLALARGEDDLGSARSSLPDPFPSASQMSSSAGPTQYTP